MHAGDDAGDDAAQLQDLDAFCASGAALDGLAATLGSAQAGGWTHDQLEDHLETDG